jgi:MoxR-like ATPase
MPPEPAAPSAIETPATDSSAHQAVLLARRQMGRKIIGQKNLLDRLFIALLSDGHLLVEGAPGLAKTRAVHSIADLIEGDFQRIQFTPDLLPADLTGTEIWQPDSGEFTFKSGPLFHNIILADEINRASAKVQSALLESMAERQITVGNTTHTLPPLFMVMATQNPIEQEGTFPLPEAQLDRFLLHVNVGYPDIEEEIEILRLNQEEAVQGLEQNNSTNIKQMLSEKMLNQARKEVLNVHLSPAVERYLVELVIATRKPSIYDVSLAKYLEYGASPRATIALNRTARAHAWMQGRDYVSPTDIQSMVPDVLRHRVLLTYQAQAEGIDVDQFVNRLLELVPVS